MTYLSELAPVENMARIKFENEWIIDFRFDPDFTVQAEQEKEEEHQEVAAVDLILSALGVMTENLNKPA